MAQKPSSTNKMPLKAGHLFLVGAIVMALITAVLFTSMLKPKDKVEKSEKQEDTVDVVVADDYIPGGRILEDSDLKTVKFPKDFLVSDSYFSKKYELIGQTLRSDVVPGEIVYKQKLSGEGSRGGLPVLIPEGMRAVSVEISEVRGVAGLIKPGDRVDVMATFDVKDEEGSRGDKQYITRTVLQDVQVLALAQTIVNEARPDVTKPKALRQEDEEIKADDKKDKKSDKEKEKTAREMEREKKEKQKEREEMEKRLRSVNSVTLALTPEQAEKVALIDEATDVHLALRREGDHSAEPVAGANSQQIIFGKTGGWPFNEPKPAAPVANNDFTSLQDLNTPSGPGGPSVELIEGTTKSSVNF